MSPILAIPGEVVRLPNGASVPVTLQVLDYELFHFCPLMEVIPEISFAPISLLDMFNAGGAVESFQVLTASDTPVGQFEASTTSSVALKVRRCRRFGAYCSRRPVKCVADGIETGFEYEPNTGLMTFRIPVAEEEMHRWSVVSGD